MQFIPILIKMRIFKEKTYCLHTRRPSTVLKKTRYTVALKLRTFSLNTLMNPSENIRCLFRNKCIGLELDEIAKLRHRVKSFFFFLILFVFEHEHGESTLVKCPQKI